MHQFQVTFQGILHRLSTTSDGGWRVTFDVSQSDAEALKELSRMREDVLQIACVSQTRRFISEPEQIKEEESA